MVSSDFAKPPFSVHLRPRATHLRPPRRRETTTETRLIPPRPFFLPNNEEEEAPTGRTEHQ